MAYATVEDLYRVTGITEDTIIQDDMLQHILEAGAWIDSYFGTTFETQEKTETLDGNGATYMFLNRYPVKSITSLKINGTTVTKYYLYKDTGKVVLKSDSEVGYFDNTYPQSVEITYTYGHDLDFDLPANNPLAYTIRNLTLKIASISAWIQQIGGTFDDVTSYQLPEFSASKGEPYTNIREAVNKMKEQVENMLGNEMLRGIARNAYFA